MNFELLALTALRAWGFLLFNMILCDLRDVKATGLHGDAQPARVARGAPRSRAAPGMIVAIDGLTLARWPTTPTEHLAPSGAGWRSPRRLSRGAARRPYAAARGAILRVVSGRNVVSGPLLVTALA